MSGLPSRLETVTKKQFIVDAAEALKILFRHVAEVKNKAELVVLAANQRIGEEIRAIPKATAPHRPADKKLPSMVNSKKEGRAATGIPGTSRSRLPRHATRLARSRRYASDHCSSCTVWCRSAA